jgi:hypothetical protein
MEKQDNQGLGAEVGSINHITWNYTTNGDEAQKRPGLTVPWSGLSLGLFVLSLASLGTLSVVASIKDVDLLSTVALALALLAFAAQLIISLAQAQGSAQQLNQSERVNTETKSTLAEVRSTTKALLTNQSDQFNKVLSALLRQATENAVREVAGASAGTDDTIEGPIETLDPEAIAERVEERVRVLFARQFSSESNEQKLVDHTLGRSLGISTIDLALSLSPGALLVFASMAAQAWRSPIRVARKAFEPAPLVELQQKDLIELTGTGSIGNTYTFTRIGRMLAILIRGNHFDSDWYWHKLQSEGPNEIRASE